MQKVAQNEGQAVGIGGADDFRGDFREYEDGEGDEQRAGGQRPFFLAEQFNGNNADQGCRCRVDEIVTEQDDAQHLVGLVEQGEGFSGAVMSRLGEVTQTEAVGRHHRRFGHREKSRQGEEDDQRRQLRR